MVKIKSKQAGVKVFKKNPEFEYTFDTTETAIDIPEEIAKIILKNPIFYKEKKKKKEVD